MSRPILLAVVAGAVSGLLTVGTISKTSLAVMLSHFTLLPLFTAGLGIGVSGVVIAALTGLVIVAASLGVQSGGIVGLQSGGIYFLFNAVPALILSRQALLRRTRPDNQVEWYPGGALVAWLIAIAVAYFLLALAYFAIARNGLMAAIHGELEALIEALGNVVPTQNADAVFRAAPFIPGIAASYFILNVVLNAALAQHLLRRSGRNLRPSIALKDLSLPPPLLYLLAVSIVAAVVSQALAHIALTLAFVIAVAYFLLGLAVVHAYLGRRSNPGTSLFGFYVIFILLMILLWPVGLAIIGLGIVEQVLGLRGRFSAPGAGEEEE